MALKIGMLDKIGGEEEAVKYLTDKYVGFDKLPIVDWKYQRRTKNQFGVLLILCKMFR